MEEILRKYGGNMDCIWRKYGVLVFVSAIKILIDNVIKIESFDTFDKVNIIMLPRMR